MPYFHLVDLIRNLCDPNPKMAKATLMMNNAMDLFSYSFSSGTAYISRFTVA